MRLNLERRGAIVRWVGIGLLGLLAMSCGKPDCKACDALVVAATGEPTTLIPPLVSETVGRDISDLVFERLAILKPGGAPTDPNAYGPGLAARWTRVDSLTWRFELRPNASWQDGKPVTPGDVAFSFRAYADTAAGNNAGPTLEGLAVTAEGANGFTVKFPRAYPEQLYDAVYAVRILPEHVWSSKPVGDWAGDTSLVKLVGSGPYRVTDWQHGQSLKLERVPTASSPSFRQIIWRFAADPDAALNLVLAHEADLLETVTSPSAQQRARGDTSLGLVSYPSAVYGFLGFRHADLKGKPHPILSQRAVRRALTESIDRPTLVHATLGAATAVTPAPMSRAIWIWDDSIKTLSYDTAAANRELDAAGWARGADGVRAKGGSRLAVDILVPSTSAVRRQLAEGIQQMWRAVGVAATVTAVDFPVFQERLGQGRFDAMIGAWLDEPSPRSLAIQWTKDGFGVLNHGRYDNRAFDSLFALATSATDAASARRTWRQAMDTLNADAAGIFLYTPTTVAVVDKRLEGVAFNPFSWLEGVGTWRKRQ